VIAPDGPWIALHRHEQPNADQIGVVSVPGVPFIGGTSLAIWKHSRQQAAALELVRFLSHEPLEWVGQLHNDLFPTRLQSLRALAEQNALYQHAGGLQNGRSFPPCGVGFR
jgi:ABC-type glycerol-3-phosphate transport system substrate-binding protein